MGKPICVGMNLKFSTDNATAQATITGILQGKVKCGGLQAWFDKVDITVNGASQGNFVQTAPANGSIIATATKVSSNNKKAVLLGDKNITPILCAAVDASTGATITIPVTVTIIDAGQNKVMAI